MEIHKIREKYKTTYNNYTLRSPQEDLKKITSSRA
jgi:hypothetical protein